MHISPTSLTALFASIPSGGGEIAKFSISTAQLEVLHSTLWHRCVAASVTADNDCAFAPAAYPDNPIVLRRYKLAQRNLSFINGIADTAVGFSFLAGRVLNTDRVLELVINRAAMTKAMPLQLALDGENANFAHVDVDTDSASRKAMTTAAAVWSSSTRRARTVFAGCEGVLT